MIYLDNAATMPMFSELNEIIERYNCSQFFNPSTLYVPAAFKADMRAAKQTLADVLGAHGSEIIMTSGATEANNLALRGILHKNKTVVISGAEHACVYNTARYLKDTGTEVIFLPVQHDGRCDLASFEQVLSDKAQQISLVSIIHVSNETGALNDIKKISELIKKYNPKIIFHSDGVQAYCKTENVSKYVDMYSFSGHKVGAPKGVGALYVKKGVKINPLIFGGGQEGGLRSGTENVSGLFAFAESVKLFKAKYDHSKITNLKRLFIDIITTQIPDCTVNSADFENTMPHIVSISIPKINAETLLHMLEDQKIYIGLGSACSSNDKGNRVLDALGFSKERIKGTVRISMSCNTTKEDIITAASALVECVKRLRNGF